MTSRDSEKRSIVGLDLRPTEAGFKAHAGRGTGRYAEALTEALSKLEPADGGERAIELKRLGSEELNLSEEDLRFSKLLPLGRRTFESQMLYPRRIKRAGVDLIHFFSHGDAPAWSSVPQVVTVLDVIPLRFPELYRAKKTNLRFRFARYLEYAAITRAVGLLAISECTKRDVVSYLGVPAEKIVVTPLGVGGEFTPRGKSLGVWPAEIHKKKKLLGIPEERPVLLYVGGIDPRKNVLFLLDVLREVLREHTGERPCLVLAGKHEKDDQYPLLQEKIKRLELEKDVIQLGFVPDENLSALYHVGDAFLFPSLYEGFGFPVLEAMACGTPVVAGNNSSIPEVAGTSARLLADNDLATWTGAVLELLSSSDLRLSLGREGIQRAAMFTWDRTARETYAAYEKFLRISAPALRVHNGASNSGSRCHAA